jgi:arylsulfatase A-like enzyme
MALPRILVAWLAAIGGLGLTAGAQAQQTSPNILLIISDDIGFDVTSNMYPGAIDRLVEQYGPDGLDHPDYEMIDGRPASTPTLDALARSGISFTQVWVQPFCSTTRASILTGLTAAKTHVIDYNRHVTHSHHSFVKDMKEKAGYSTAVFGKWHMAGLGNYPGMRPKEAGFDLFLGNLHGGLATYWDYDYHVQDDATPPDQWRTEEPPARTLPGIEATTYGPVVKVADTIDWITAQEQERPDKPWLAWLAFNVSHITGNQQPNPMAVPNADTLNELARREIEACGGTFGSANVGACSSEALMRAMTNSMDTVIARLLDVVDELDPNTYVIYIGDNGTWMFGEGREFIDNMYITRRDRSKGTVYESGVRVPLTVRGPRIAAGTRSDEPVNGVDLFATILELAGLDVPRTVPDSTGSGTVAVDGVSLTPILFDEASTVRDPNNDYLLAETQNPIRNNMRQAAARNGTFKVLCTDGVAGEACEFYNLARDPLEEFPLEKPVSCAGYDNGDWTPANEGWHFCRLLGVIENESLLASDWDSSPGSPPGGSGRAGRAGGRGAQSGPRGAGGRGAPIGGGPPGNGA